jgi:ferric-dicitrate binding protein FerR (iron transport regulator)
MTDFYAPAHVGAHREPPTAHGEVAVLSERECRILADIERHLQEDDQLRAFVDRSYRRARRMRRVWLLLLIAAGVLWLGMAALGSAAGAGDSLLLGVVSAVLLYFSPCVSRSATRESG